MEISINGKPADIIIETEKNIAELLAGLEQWLEGSGSRLSGLTINGTEINASRLPAAMEKELANINTLDIRISTWDELAMEALDCLQEYCSRYAGSSFEDRRQIREGWEKSAAGTFLSAEIRDIFDLSCLTFSGEGISAADLNRLAEERQNELADPAGEIIGMEKPVSEITGRMIDLPLDIQTGKDSRAAETIRLFSGMGEKIFRILQIQGRQGNKLDLLQIEGSGIKTFLDDFSSALRELAAAYGNQDAVLVGDLAEYELAPRLSKLFTALKEFAAEEVRR